jgi:bifunctional oligoribonuclease and PAP phosphatase NrnA
MSSPPNQTTTAQADLEAVVDAIRHRQGFLVTTHENPDGDALGSLLASHLALRSLGKDSVMFLGGPAPLPGEYRFLPLGELRRVLPADAGERTLLAVDCANESRLGADPAVFEQTTFTINVDHHHDNSRFGDVNLIDADASSTGEVLRDVLRELDVELTPELAEPLYVALVTDTGRFQYANTTPKALRLAAELVEAGADVHKVFQDVYETVQFAKLKLLARALERAQVYEGGRLVVSYLLRDDFGQVGAVEPYSEGIIDFLRAVEGADMAALIREPPRGGTPARRISLRASHDELDVSAIARASGGGGHPQAAGFSSEASIEEITDFLRREFALAFPGLRGSAGRSSARPPALPAE